MSIHCPFKYWLSVFEYLCSGAAIALRPFSISSPSAVHRSLTTVGRRNINIKDEQSRKQGVWTACVVQVHTYQTGDRKASNNGKDSRAASKSCIIQKAKIKRTQNVYAS